DVLSERSLGNRLGHHQGYQFLIRAFPIREDSSLKLVEQEKNFEGLHIFWITSGAGYLSLGKKSARVGPRKLVLLDSNVEPQWVGDEIQGYCLTLQRDFLQTLLFDARFAPLN